MTSVLEGETLVGGLGEVVEAEPASTRGEDEDTRSGLVASILEPGPVIPALVWHHPDGDPVRFPDVDGPGTGFLDAYDAAELHGEVRDCVRFGEAIPRQIVRLLGADTVRKIVERALTMTPLDRKGAKVVQLAKGPEQGYAAKANPIRGLRGRQLSMDALIQDALETEEREAAA